MEEVNKLGKILIVDDNEDVLFALNLLLEPYTEKIKVATTPDRIEHFMTTFQPDLILLDMNFSRDAISGQEGFESLKQILLIDPQAIVIFMTAYADTDKAVRAIKAGATDFIPKPWEKKTIGNVNLRYTVASISARSYYLKRTSRSTQRSKFSGRRYYRRISRYAGSLHNHQQAKQHGCQHSDSGRKRNRQRRNCQTPVPLFTAIRQAICNHRPGKYPRTIIRKRTIRI